MYTTGGGAVAVTSGLRGRTLQKTVVGARFVCEEKAEKGRHYS